MAHTGQGTTPRLPRPSPPRRAGRRRRRRRRRRRGRRRSRCPRTAPRYSAAGGITRTAPAAEACGDGSERGGGLRAGRPASFPQAGRRAGPGRGGHSLACRGGKNPERSGGTRPWAAWGQPDGRWLKMPSTAAVTQRLPSICLPWNDSCRI
ncbi:PREDICTED: serine/arginine repetitive matrix protein 3-like [Calidris pugnax]|uniref:serine/arginine repetitive matrix protein 3-like n=1 Tax=Calidris pugnax TaxID=198806 RepID=UPI00071C4D10|nr:PREDICTED: serine/arginine repetitive matrix protein 3-like [Calidris pugnax]